MIKFKTSDQTNKKEIANKGCDRCPQCGATGFYDWYSTKGIIYWGTYTYTKKIVFGIPVPERKDSYSCNECKAEWTSKGY